VNFKASQGGEIPLRYRLTTHGGQCNDAAAARFGAEVSTPALVLRDYLRTGPATGSLLALPNDQSTHLTAKPAEDGDGVIVRLQEMSGQDREVTVHTTVPCTFACLSSPLEVNGASLAVEGNSIRVPVAARGVQSVRLRFTV
jgi:alpha-mannosidase